MKKYRIRKGSAADKMVNIALHLKWNWKMYLAITILIAIECFLIYDWLVMDGKLFLMDWFKFSKGVQ